MRRWAQKSAALTVKFHLASLTHGNGYAWRTAVAKKFAVENLLNTPREAAHLFSLKNATPNIMALMSGRRYFWMRLL